MRVVAATPLATRMYAPREPGVETWRPRGVVVGHEGGGDGRGPRFVEFNDPDGNVLALFEYEERA